MEEAREKGGVETGGGSDGRWRRHERREVLETGGGSDERWRRHERREVWRREVEVTGGGGGTREGRCGDGRWK